VLVSNGASYDAARSGRTHHAPEDVAVLAALPGWTIHVPGHPDELERVFGQSLRGDDRVYIRTSEESNHAPVRADGLVVLRDAAVDAPFVVAVGPTLSPTLEATADLDVGVGYLATVRPFDADGLRAAVRGTDVVLVEPYLAGTSSAEAARALADRPRRLLALGVRNEDLRRYGTREEHRAAHGLDAKGIRAAVTGFHDCNRVATQPGC
jgi:transketolase